MNTNKYPLERKVRVLSLGAGVQSSCLAWLYETEKLENTLFESNKLMVMISHTQIQNKY